MFKRIAQTAGFAGLLAAIVLTSVSSLRAHHAHGAVRWDVVRLITPGILAGTFGATFIAARRPRSFNGRSKSRSRGSS